MAVALQSINWRKVNRVAIALVLAVSFLLLVCWTAPRAQAITLTVAAGVTTLALLVLAVCGITITAPDKQSNIDYLQPKLAEYAASLGFASIDNWISNVTGHTVSILNLFSIVGGAISLSSDIANALLAFADSFITDEGITSGGSAVGNPSIPVPINVENPSGQYASYTGTFTAQVTSKTSFSVKLDQWRNLTWYNNTTYPSQNAFVIIPLGLGTFDITVSWEQGTNGNINPVTVGYGLNFHQSQFATSVSNTGTIQKTLISGSSWNATYRITRSNENFPYFAWSLPMSSRSASPIPIFDGTITFTFNEADFMTEGGTLFTPSDNVSIPNDLVLGENLLLKNSGIVDTMSNEDALDKVLDDTTQPGGLTAEPDKDGYAVPAGSEWLYNALEGLNESVNNQNPHTDWIPNTPFSFSFSGIWHYVEDWIDSFTSGIAAILSVWNQVPLLSGALYGALVAAVVVGVWRRFFE